MLCVQSIWTHKIFNKIENLSIRGLEKNFRTKLDLETIDSAAPLPQCQVETVETAHYPPRLVRGTS